MRLCSEAGEPQTEPGEANMRACRVHQGQTGFMQQLMDSNELISLALPWLRWLHSGMADIASIDEANARAVVIIKRGRCTRYQPNWECWFACLPGDYLETVVCIQHKELILGADIIKRG